MKSDAEIKKEVLEEMTKVDKVVARAIEEGIEPKDIVEFEEKFYGGMIEKAIDLTLSKVGEECEKRIAIETDNLKSEIRGLHETINDLSREIKQERQKTLEEVLGLIKKRKDLLQKECKKAKEITPEDCEELDEQYGDMLSQLSYIELKLKKFWRMTNE